MLFLSYIFNSQEYCRDTSDTESYTTDGIATMDVLEYELASTSESDGRLYTDDSSSGTDVKISFLKCFLFCA